MADQPTSITMNVSLPAPLKEYVDGKVSSGLYASASEFVREAVREKLQRDQDLRDARTSLTGKLLAGLDSGPPIPFTDDYFTRKKRALIARRNNQKKHP